MTSTTDTITIINFVLDNEGGFVIDNGGPTNFGITANYLMDEGFWEYDRNHNNVIDEDDMRNFMRDDAVAVYTRMFNKGNYDFINNADLVSRVFDMSVNSGSHQAILLLQRSYNQLAGQKTLIEDGLLGFSTALFVNRLEDQHSLLEKYKKLRAQFYHELAESNPAKYDKYLIGWLKRASL